MIGILQVKNDIGRCRPLYDAAQNMIDAGCVMGLDSLVSCALRCITSYCSYAWPAQPGPIWTRLGGPCIAAIASD